jgi:hypothetical protein
MPSSGALTPTAALLQSSLLERLAKEDPAGVYKLLTSTLPVMRQLTRRHPELFPSDQCPLCKKKVTETTRHMLMECTAHSLERDNLLASVADWISLLCPKEEPFPPEMALPDDQVQRALSDLDPQDKFPRPTGEEPEAAHLFERRPARYEGDSTVIRVNTSAFPLLASAKDGSHLITTVRESRFWQLVAQHRTLKAVAPLTKTFIVCLVASLRDYAEDSATVRAGLKVTRDVSYWACRQSFLRILVAELGLDTELFCSLLNSFPGLDNHFSIIPGDKEWGYKMDAYASR